MPRLSRAPLSWLAVRPREGVMRWWPGLDREAWTTSDMCRRGDPNRRWKYWATIQIAAWAQTPYWKSWEMKGEASIGKRPPWGEATSSATHEMKAFSSGGGAIIVRDTRRPGIGRKTT